jgi:hypothetical protein
VPGGRGRFLEGGLTSYNTDLQVAALLAPAGTIAAYRKLENGKSLCGGGGGSAKYDRSAFCSSTGASWGHRIVQEA